MDKLMRDKLKGIEFPYDPRNWEQMEKMLDDKKDRKGFFWWWTTGMAAILIFGIAGYWAMKETGNKPIAQTTTVVQEHSKGNDAEVSNSATTTISEEKAAEVIVPVTNSKPAEASSVSSKLIKENKQVKSSGNSVVGKQQVGHSFKTNSIGHKEGKKQLRSKIGKRQQQMPIAIASKVQKEAENDGYVLAAEIKPEAIQVPTKLIDHLDIKDDEAGIITISDGNDEALKPTRKKIVFHYSIGALGNITASIAGPVHSRTNVPIRDRSSFYNKPSYMVGLTEDFMLGKRFAFTNSLLFSRTSFSVINPKTASFSTVPVQYSSKISELNIALGVKAYPISKEHVRMYVGTGVINHIKLKETFAYKLPPPATSSTYDPSTVPPSETDFSVNGSQAYTNSPGGERSNTGDFSINRAKRYYTSFYGSVGAELVVQRHYVFFAETMFYMSLQKIGVQDMHKYNLGASGGFRYQF